MKKKKLSVKALMSLVLSAILFCMPAGAFFANRANTVEVHAEDTEEQQTESTGNTESTGSTGNTVTPGNGKEENAGDGKTEDSTEGTAEGTTEETEPAKCTCTEKCSQYEVDKDCAVCSKDYKECAYVNPSVKITIATPTGWHNDTTKVHISVEDTVKSGNFSIQKVKAKVAQNGSWTDITEDMYVEISENSTIYVQVTDQKGKTYEKNRYIKCFDFTKPTLNAAVSDGLLSIQAHDTDSGIKAIYVNGYEFTEHTNGALNIRLQQFDAGYQYFTISAMDNAGNISEIYKTANPYYTDPETKDSNEKDPAEQLPVDASATQPSSATAQVTEHTKTDSNGNTISETGNGTGTGTSSTKQSPGTGDTTGSTEKNSESSTSEQGKEFYTIQTASEKVFYLVIDRDGDEEKVYFLTEVSENDLLNTTSDNSETLPKNSAALESAIPVKDAALDNNNTDATGNKKQDAETVEENTEESTEEASKPETTEQKQDGSGFAYLIMGIAAVAVIGMVYVIKAKKKKENFIDDDEDELEDDYEEDYNDEDEEEADPDEEFMKNTDAEEKDTENEEE